MQLFQLNMKKSLELPKTAESKTIHFLYMKLTTSTNFLLFVSPTGDSAEVDLSSTEKFALTLDRICISSCPCWVETVTSQTGGGKKLTKVRESKK